MRKLLFFLAITVSLLFVILNSFAADGKQLNLSKYENNIIDNTKFITFKDDEGQVKIVKTLASLRFDDDEIKFEIGDFIPIYEEQTNVPDYRAYFERPKNMDD